MRLPESLPTKPSQADQPVYAFAAFDGDMRPQFIDFLDLNKIKCATACVRKAGYGACVARCLLDGQACDGGLDNCSGA